MLKGIHDIFYIRNDALQQRIIRTVHLKYCNFDINGGTNPYL